MGRKKKIYYCKKCGKRLEKKTQSGLCLDCALENYYQNLKQMMNQQGFFWDRWTQGMIRWAMRKALSPDDVLRARALGILKKYAPEIYEKAKRREGE